MAYVAANRLSNVARNACLPVIAEVKVDCVYVQKSA